MKSFLFPHSEQLKVFVYRNLHAKMWSVKALEGEHAGKVVAHAAVVNLGGGNRLSGIEFKVSEAGRQRVLKEKRKNVHAGIIGYMYHAVVTNERYPLKGHATKINNDSKFLECTRDDHPAYREIVYNPYKYDRFVFADTLEPATITDYKDQSVILESDGKVLMMSIDALCKVIREKNEDK